MRIHAIVLKHFVYDADDGPVGTVGIAPALQHTGTARLQAEREYIETDVGPGLVDDGYDPEGHTDTPDVQPIRKDILP